MIENTSYVLAFDLFYFPFFICLIFKILKYLYICNTSIYWCNIYNPANLNLAYQSTKQKLACCKMDTYEDLLAIEIIKKCTDDDGYNLGSNVISYICFICN